jgi:hypothetical protein
MNQFPHHAATSNNGNRAFKMKSLIAAVGTGEFPSDAVIRLRANLAARMFDKLNLQMTLLAKVVTLRNAAGTLGAVRREKQCRQWINDARESHGGGKKQPALK